MVEFGHKLGVPQSAISAYESGKYSPRRSVLLTLLRMAEGVEKKPIMDALGVDADLQNGWHEGELEAILERFESDARSAAGKKQDTIRAFAEAAREVISQGGEIEPALVEILKQWLRHGGNPEARQLFQHVAVFLDVQLKPFETREATSKRVKRSQKR